MNSQISKIIVGEGTCGIAAGAKPVLEAFQKLASGVKISTTGCKGMCHREVISEIRTADGQSFLYGDVTPKNIERILNYHNNNDQELPSELLISSTIDSKNSSAAYLKQQTRIALRNIGEIDPTSIDEYISLKGYEAIRKIILEKTTSENIIQEIKISKLRGRGGAGFPTNQKWQFAKNTDAQTKYLICNGDEGDPGAFMDRSILEGDPHSVIEGMLIAARAIGANIGYAYIRAEYPLAIEHFEKAIADAKEHNLLGENILKSDFSFTLEVKHGAGAFVCGEETALIASIEGERGMPRIRPPFPATNGLFGKPTIINNVETLANLPWIILNSGKKYAKYGTEKAGGTKVFALAGAIKKGGLVEVPLGTSIHKVIYEIGGGSLTERPLKAVQLGGPSGGCIPESMFNTLIDYDSINETGAIMGSGGMIVLDTKTCMVDLARYFLEFTQLESCGKCTFCRIGTLRMKEILTKICEGKGTMKDLDNLEILAHKVKSSSLCGLGQTAPNPVLTTLKYFRQEYEEHVNEKKCVALVCKSLIHHTIDNSKCVGCSACKKQCPVNAISGTPKQGETFNIDKDVCINCGMCLEACKFDAIFVD